MTAQNTSTITVNAIISEINKNISFIGKRLVSSEYDSTIYEELVRIRKAVENEVVVSSE